MYSSASSNNAAYPGKLSLKSKSEYFIDAPNHENFKVGGSSSLKSEQVTLGQDNGLDHAPSLDLPPNTTNHNQGALVLIMFREPSQSEHDPPQNSSVDIGASFELRNRPHLFPGAECMLDTDWVKVQELLPSSWMWDVEYHKIHFEHACLRGTWTCTPLEISEPRNFLLTIAKAPVVLPVEHQWPPIGGVSPPPNPRPSSPIDCRAEIPMTIV